MRRSKIGEWDIDALLCEFTGEPIKKGVFQGKCVFDYIELFVCMFALFFSLGKEGLC